MENKVTNSEYDAIIFVDGSFDVKTGRYAYGMQVSDSSGVSYYCEAFDKDDKSSMRNVAGEIAGATAAMQYCLDRDYHKMKLCYDYIGIQAWCEPLPGQSKTWARNTRGTSEYADFYKKAARSLDINFEHVKGHSGVDGNEICDSLAKSALGIEDSKVRKYSDIVNKAEPYRSDDLKIVDKVVSQWGDLREDEYGQLEFCC